MNDKYSSYSCKEYCSISELAKLLNLSRAQFYNHMGKVFPYPIYDICTRRPFYTKELQEICLHIRRTNIAYDGSPILFYSPRKKGNLPPKKSTPETNDKSTARNPRYEEWVETLKSMGLPTVKYGQVESVVKQLYPNGVPEDEGTILREIYRNIRQEM